MTDHCQGNNTPYSVREDFVARIMICIWALVPRLAIAWKEVSADGKYQLTVRRTWYGECDEHM